MPTATPRGPTRSSRATAATSTTTSTTKATHTSTRGASRVRCSPCTYQEMRRMIVLLHSGGLDSQVCWLMHQDWKPVYVRHGAGNERAELQALADIQQMMPTFNPQVIELGFTPKVERD